MLNVIIGFGDAALRSLTHPPQATLITNERDGTYLYPHRLTGERWDLRKTRAAVPPAPPSLSEVKDTQNNLGETHKLSTVFSEVKFYWQGVLYKNAEHRPQPARSCAPPVPKNKHLIIL